MEQFYEIKNQHPEALLLFRVGDFYEMYGNDAIKGSEILGIALTMKAKNTENAIHMAGFPHHALDTYLPKLVRAGLRVAICDQLEDPKATKKLVKRGITELVTPGVSINDNILINKENNFLAAVHFNKTIIGAAFLDISTGEFLVAEGSFDYIEKILNNFAPKEILHERTQKKIFEEVFGKKNLTFEQEDWIYTEDSATNRLLKQFETKNLKGFGISNLNNAIIAAGAILYYMDSTHHEQLKHITTISRIEKDQFVWLDKFTIRNLELYSGNNESAKALIDVIDKTNTPMGGRLLKRWLSFPLKNELQITKRHQIVEYFFRNPDKKEFLNEHLSFIGDLERIVSKIAVGRVSPRDIWQLRNALCAIAPIREMCIDSNEELIRALGEQISDCNSIREKIEKEINENPPLLLTKGNIIRSGVNEELDELRDISTSGKDFLLKIQQRESERTEIPSLKVGYNNVFGYFIEVRNTYKEKVPETWIRKQTLVNAERYITQELKEYEEKILGAEERISVLESIIFNNLISFISDFTSTLQINCNIIAQIDCLFSFAKIAEENNYIRPIITEENILDIKAGRHPVIEKRLPIGEEYIPNDVYLDDKQQQIIIITGPNMAGKSALLRQTALIVLLAQIGSFVPAESAKIGLVDKIFTRVGASDNISAGESTFMVEMSEAASILNNLSDRSLVLFDELGRGTSTYDGISIAWAIVEYIHEHPTLKAKTLFATHYHELNEMERTFSRIKNYNVSVKEIDKKVIFLRKLLKGGSEHSFGIHVAKMAGMPPSIVKRSEEILVQLEKSQNKDNISKPINEIINEKSGIQLSFFQLDDPVLEQIRDEIKNADINNLTPIEALNKLNEIKKIITGKRQ
ncbi:MAG: DNA mismatch repair protein MutS [Paludibacteraceae bacterium]|nr:DNA mismatch repair protein MutS [Paludibacteraceae bacterium]